MAVCAVVWGGFFLVFVPVSGGRWKRLEQKEERGLWEDEEKDGEVEEGKAGESEEVWESEMIRVGGFCDRGICVHGMSFLYRLIFMGQDFILATVCFGRDEGYSTPGLYLLCMIDRRDWMGGIGREKMKQLSTPASLRIQRVEYKERSMDFRLWIRRVVFIIL